MADNENVVVEETPAAEPEKESFGAKVKEFFRKKLVSLKRKPHMIALVFFVITSLIYVCSLGSFSEAIISYFIRGAKWSGQAVFVNFLFSILILLLYLYAFPKRKKPQIVFIVLVFVFAAIMITMDVVFYMSLSKELQSADEATKALACMRNSLNVSIVHIVFMGISVILLATLPLYKKLIMKINTKKVVEGTEMTEEIDTAEE